MSLTLNDSDAFVSALRATEGETLAFLVGAPISKRDGQGVPDVEGVLGAMRTSVERSDVLNLAVFDAAVGDADVGSRYRNAVDWLLVYGGGISKINRLVRDAVLQARRPGAPELPPGTDGHPSDWLIPQGIRDLAKLVCSDDPRFHGPILTTNFDPLIELAIEEAGGYAVTRSVTRDGDLFGLQPGPGVRQVIHLHGFWRDSDTLHTAGQLEGKRAKLMRSLQAVLREHRLVVASYGGWNDVFTQALTDLVETEETANVVWGFYETDPAAVERQHAALLERIRPALGTRFIAYGGVDVHTVFGEVAAGLDGDRIARSMRGDPAPTAREVSPLAGWEVVDEVMLDSLVPLTDEEAIRYFDGVVPTWRNALSDAIPRRQRVGEILADLERAAHEGGGGSSLHLIVAASGEGKSTLLLQTAVDASRRAGWRVLARPAPGVGLDADDVLGLDDRWHWLLVSDDAEELAGDPRAKRAEERVGDLERCARALHEKGKRNVHFLLAARDTDWRQMGRKVRWQRFGLQYEDPAPLVGVSDADAAALVAAWERLGRDALGSLADVEPAERVAAFQRAVLASGRGRRKGSLLGGLLDARFGAAALQAHIGLLLSRLREMPVRGSTHTLYDAIVFVAACHCGRGPGLSLPVLADLLGVDRRWVSTEVVRRLGEEAVAVGGVSTVRTRHPRIAEAVVAEAESGFDTDLAEVWTAIVRQTMETRREEWIDYDCFGYVAHAGPDLVDDLRALPRDRRSDVALAAAEASARALPDRLDVVVSFARTLRDIGQPADGVALLRNQLDAAFSKDDYQRVIRGYWNEWGTCEGEAGASLNAAVIQGAALSDLLSPSRLDDARIAKSCSGIGKAFERLVERKGDVWGHALRGATTIGSLSNDIKRDHLDYSNHRCDRLGIPQATGLEEALEWLEAGVRAAHARLEDAELKTLTSPEAVTFHSLRVRLGIGDDVGGQPVPKTSPKKPRPPRRDRDPYLAR